MKKVYVVATCAREAAKFAAGARDASTSGCSQHDSKPAALRVASHMRIKFPLVSGDWQIFTVKLPAK